MTLAQETDRNGLPVANFSYCNVRQRPAIQSAAQWSKRNSPAAGATEIIAIKRYAHLVGGCRMAEDERSGVVNADHQSFAVRTSIWSTAACCRQGSANPALTIMALAARCADRLLARARGGSVTRAERAR